VQCLVSVQLLFMFSYTIESLRLAFSRINNDNLICIVTMYNEGYLSVKHM